MRIVPILTAIATVVLLFFLIFERDRVLEFAGIDMNASEEAETTATEGDGDIAETDAAEPREGVSVIAMQSEAREIDNAVVLRGRTGAARMVELKAETSGKVVSAPTPKGTLVEAGDVLCELDLGTREASLAEAQARLAEARANAPTTAARVAEAEARLNEAELNLSNAEALAEDGFAAETRVLSARAALESARASVVAAKAGAASIDTAIESGQSAVAAATRDMANTSISAPFAGVLETDTAELGTLLQPGSPCATVLDLDPVKLVGFISEVDVDRITLGSRVGARLASGREVLGQVTFLSRSADETTRTFRVEAEVPNSDLTIRDGQTAEMLIQTQGRLAHLLPQSTLSLDDAGALGVRVAEATDDGDAAKFLPVELLRDTRDGVWVSGLPQTVRVIVTGQDYVTDGVLLDVTMRESGT